MLWPAQTAGLGSEGSPSHAGRVVVSSAVMSGSALGAYAPSRASTPALFGRVMGLVALTVGFATLGVWLGRDSGGAAWFIAWLLAIGCLIGLNLANTRGNTSLALVLLFAFGLLIGFRGRPVHGRKPRPRAKTDSGTAGAGKASGKALFRRRASGRRTCKLITTRRTVKATS